MKIVRAVMDFQGWPVWVRVALSELAGLIAPIVVLFYRGGWFNTPDDAVAPRGLGEPALRRRLAKWGVYWSDWWWLGIRNRAYGLRYYLKPDFFKGLVYSGLTVHSIKREYAHRWYGTVRKTTIFGCDELAFEVRWRGKVLFHVLYGYRMTPIFNEVYRNLFLARHEWDVPHRPINMDARPILSIRAGEAD